MATNVTNSSPKSLLAVYFGCVLVVINNYKKGKSCTYSYSLGMILNWILIFKKFQLKS